MRLASCRADAAAVHCFTAHHSFGFDVGALLHEALECSLMVFVCRDVQRSNALHQKQSAVQNRRGMVAAAQAGAAARQ
jgi:hypothetical protein